MLIFASNQKSTYHDAYLPKIVKADFVKFTRGINRKRKPEGCNKHLFMWEAEGDYVTHGGAKTGF